MVRKLNRWRSGEGKEPPPFLGPPIRGSFTGKRRKARTNQPHGWMEFKAKTGNLRRRNSSELCGIYPDPGKFSYTFDKLAEVIEHFLEKTGFHRATLVQIQENAEANNLARSQQHSLCFDV